MGPLIPSITLTDSDEVTSHLMTAERTEKNPNGTSFQLGNAITSKGNLVMVCKANPNDPLYYQYFCHGHSLGTYRRFGYSVCSGESILRALIDDYVEIGAGQTVSETIQLLKSGDIVSFAELSGRIMHTAKVFCIDINPNVPLRPIEFNDIILSSKNEYHPDCLQSLETTFINCQTAHMVRFWRDKLTCFDATMHS
jgi:hypothetical protein